MNEILRREEANYSNANHANANANHSTTTLLTCQYIHTATLCGINQKNSAWSDTSDEDTLLALRVAVK